MRNLSAVSLFLTLVIFAKTTFAIIDSYANEWVDPDYILSDDWKEVSGASAQTIVQGALDLAAEGPWSVLNKSVLPPTGDKHDYMSWSPYAWPDCSKVGNKTELAPEQVWKLCTYYRRDGIFNPDRLLVNDTGHFNALADAVLYNALAWRIEDDERYALNIKNFIDTWFLNPDTYMYPNATYAQMSRGPNGQTGEHVGLLDFKCFSKIASGILILRKGGSKAWTQEVDNGFQSWIKTYLKWLESSPVPQQERHWPNNHGTYFYNQWAALKILINDMDGAKYVVNDYYSTLFQKQIAKNGDQPEESARHDPYHYRAYNLHAMLTIARIGAYIGISDIWARTSAEGATIKSAMDYALPFDPNASQELGALPQMYPIVAATHLAYGDAEGKYTQFLKDKDPLRLSSAYWFWNVRKDWDGATAVPKSVLTGTTGGGGNNNGSNGGGSGSGKKDSGALGLSASVGSVALFALSTTLLGAF
jgi:hypothetical protein